MRVSTLPDDDDNILIAEYSWEQEDPRPRITKLGVFSGKKRTLGVAPLSFAHVVVDQQHEVRFALGYNAQSELAVIWKPQAGDDWQAFELPGFRDQTVTPLRFSADNNAVISQLCAKARA